MRRLFGLLFLLGIVPLVGCQQTQEDADGTTVIEEPGDGDVDVDVDAPEMDAPDVDIDAPDVDAPDVDVPDVDADAEVDIEDN